jgi:uncharacterized protein (DUF433 family)
MPVDVFISRNEAAQLSGVSATVVNKAIEQKAVRIKTSKSGSLIDAHDIGALQMFGSMPFGLPVVFKKRVSAWLRETGSGAELPLTDALIVRKSEAVEEAMRRALRYVELRQRFLEINPAVQGGEPVIRGTRIPIRGLAKQIEAGETMKVLRKEYDYIDAEAFEFATMWASANPRRGRPARPWRDTEPAAEPTGRAELLKRRRERSAASAA